MKNDHRRKFSNLSNWKEEAWKKSGLQRDSNPWPPRYRCVALPTELWSYTFTSHVFQSVGNNPVVNEYFYKCTQRSWQFMCTFFQDARWDQIGPCGDLWAFSVFRYFSAQSIVYYVAKFGVNYFVLMWIQMTEKYKFISWAILSSSVMSFPSSFKSTKSFVPFRFDFI